MILLDQGRELIRQSQKKVPAAQSEAFLVESEKRACEWSEGHLEHTTIAQSQGLGFRLIHEGRLGFSHTNRRELAEWNVVVDRALAASRSTAVDPFLDLPGPAAPSSEKTLDLWDKTLDIAAWPARTQFLESLEAEVKKRDPRIAKVLQGSYSESLSSFAVVNSKGVEAVSTGTQVSVSIACVAVEGAETQLGYAFQAARHYADLNPTQVIDRAVAHTVSLLGGKRIPSGRYDLVLDPLVAAEMLELFASALRADFVLKGKSFLASKMGQAIGSKSLTLVDDGRRKRGLGTSAYDAEGCPTQTTVLVEKGTLKNFLYDSYAARKAKHASTGNAGRGSYKGVPEPEPSNFYLEPGTLAPEALLGKVKSGIYIRNVMGLHTVDTISGDFSLGLMGQRIENGVLTHGVRGVTMAGNLLDLLKNVEALGSDLFFFGSIGSPTVWIRDISVGGE